MDKKGCENDYHFDNTARISKREVDGGIHNGDLDFDRGSALGYFRVEHNDNHYHYL